MPLKQITTATLASFLALSLTTTAASAQPRPSDIRGSTEGTATSVLDSSMGSNENKSSDSYERGEVSDTHQTSQDAFLSSDNEGPENSQQSSEQLWEDVFGSSYSFDEDRGWEKGLSSDTLIVGAILFGIAVFNDFIPGIEAPAIPGL